MSITARIAAATLAAGALFGFTGGAALAQAKKDPPITQAVGSVDKRFLTKAAEGNRAEIMTSELALKKTKNAGVQKVAEMLHKEHSQALADLKTAAQKAGVSLPQAPNAAQKAMYNRLSRLSGASFDRAFLSGQIKAHLETVNLFQMEIRSGKNGAAVLYARDYLPGIQNHTSMIVDTAQSVGVRIPQAARAYAKEQTASRMKGKM